MSRFLFLTEFKQLALSQRLRQSSMNPIEFGLLTSQNTILSYVQKVFQLKPEAGRLALIKGQSIKCIGSCADFESRPLPRSRIIKCLVLVMRLDKAVGILRGTPSRPSHISAYKMSVTSHLCTSMASQDLFATRRES